MKKDLLVKIRTMVIDLHPIDNIKEEKSMMPFTTNGFFLKRRKSCMRNWIRIRNSKMLRKRINRRVMKKKAMNLK